MSVYTIILPQVTIYVGIPLFSIGVLGNLINALVFYKNNLQNPSTFLLFLVSWSNIIYIHVSLLIRVFAVGFNIDITILTVSCCKIRYCLVQICVLTSLSCVCYAIVDQFFVSSQQEKWRRLSKLSLTRKMTLIIIFFWILYTIPFVTVADIIQRSDGKVICTIFTSNFYFVRFISYFNLPIVWTIGPISVLIIFGILTYRNVSLLRGNRNRERTQRNLTSMILLHVIFIIIGTTPLACVYTYLGITVSVVKSTDHQALDSFLENTTTVISNLTYSCSLFVYYFSSITHRNQVKLLLHIFRRHGRVAPIVNPIIVR